MAVEEQVNTGDPTRKLDLSQEELLLNQDIANQQSTTQNLDSSSEGVGGTMLPDNLAGPESNITTQSILNGQVPGATPEEQALIQSQIDAQAPSGQLGTLPSNVLFPGMTPVRQVGTVGGKVIGSQPIFGGGVQAFPVGAMLARKKALADAAALKAKAAADIVFQPERPAFEKAKRFQRGLDRQFDDYIDTFSTRAQQDFGANWKKAIMSNDTKIGREFQKGLNAMETLVGEGDQIAELFSQMDESIAAGSQVFSDEALDLRDEFNNLQGSLVNEEGIPDPNKLSNLVDKYEKLKGVVTLDTVLDDSKLDSIKGDLIQVAGVSDFDEYLQVTKTKTKDFENDVEIVVGTLVGPGGQLREHIRKGFLTEDQVKDHLLAKLGTIRETDISISQKRKGAGGNVKEEDVKGLSESTTSGSYAQYDDQGNVTGEFDLNLKTGDAFPTTSKKLDATGLDIVVDETGQTKPLSGNAKVSFIKTGAMEVNRTDMGGTRIVQEPVVIMNVEDVVSRQETEKDGTPLWVTPPVQDKEGNVIKEGDPKMIDETIIFEAPVKWNDNVEDLMKKNAKNIGLTSNAAEKIIKTQREGFKDVKSPTKDTNTKAETREMSAEELINKYRN